MSTAEFRTYMIIGLIAVAVVAVCMSLPFVLGAP